MPVTPTYPGVYIEEIASGVRTIVGVPTSITAFIGRALTGPVNEPTVINGYADFERIFGGLWNNSRLGFAVRDYFANGGGQAVIVRLFYPQFETEQQRSEAEAAAQAVKAAALQVAGKSGATPEKVKSAALNEAGKYKGKPNQQAADQIADAAKRASIVDGEAARIMANAGREKANAESATSYLRDTAASLVAKAAEVKASENGTNPALVISAADDAAKALSAAAEAVAKAAEEAADNEVLSKATENVASLAAAAKTIGALVLTAAETAAAETNNNVSKIRAAARNAADEIKNVVQGLSDSIKKKLKELTKIVADAVAAEVGGAAPVAKAKFSVGKANILELEAAYEGTWGNALRIRVEHPKEISDSLKALGISQKELFNLTVKNTKTGDSETFFNLTVKQGPRVVDKVLKNESHMVRVTDAGSLNASIPEANDEGLTNDEMKIKPFSTDDIELSKRSTGVSVAAGDGADLVIGAFVGDGKEDKKEGIYALERLIARDGIFNLLCIPPYFNKGTGSWDVDKEVVAAAAIYCEKRRAMLLVDPPSSWKDKSKAIKDFMDDVYPGIRSKNAAIFFPRLTQSNPLNQNQLEDFVPCGAMAGIFSRTDTQRGVWKAPAGIEANLIGVTKLSVLLTNDENGELNPLGINCLRAFPAAGKVIWGARTLRGADQLADEWKYIPIRRLALFMEESLYRGTQWVVFEPNDEPLWSQIRLNVGAFMHNLFRQGAFQGKTPRDAYFVKCDRETTTQNDINLGIVNILVGFAPLKPAEFVIIKIQQIAGQVQA